MLGHLQVLKTALLQLPVMQVPVVQMQVPVAASALAPGVIGDSSAAEPPAANVQVQGENREVENEHRLLCVIQS
jgi:hypothetical protein